jgi:NAD(P)-dependent dehydrogenase (short-subunit alcohol dehydrogenase family)
MLESGLGGKVCLVTGAAKGIGLATARLLEAEGARLALADNDAEGLAAADLGAHALRIAADLSTRA